jgi:hypothetical protein
MKEIEPIYKNDFGFGFYWKKRPIEQEENVQIIFRDIGFYLNLEDIREFLECVNKAKDAPKCNSCTSASCCRSILLRTPSKKIDLAVNSGELEGMNDLLSGILFHLSLRNYLRDISLN